LNLRSIAPEKISAPARLFLVGVVFNGIGNGITNVVLQLYFASIGISSATLGSIIMMNALSAAILTIPMGILADRYGKKKLVYICAASTVVAGPLLLFTRSVLMFKLAFLSFGVSNAAAVVFSPIYSSFFEKEDMDKAFGFYGALNIATISLGSLLGFIPPLLVERLGFSLSSAYWMFLALGLVPFVVQNVFYIWSVKDYEEGKANNGFRFNMASKDLVFKISLIQLLSAASVGVFISLFPFYVNKKFGLESDALGALFFASNLTSAAAQALSSKISDRLGSLKTIAVAFGLAAPFYLLMPLAPSFTWLSAFYMLRLGFATIAAPLMSSTLMKDLKEEEKATANSIRMMAMQGGGVIGPWLGGALMERASLELPAFVGGGLYAAMAALTFLMLRKARPAPVVRPIPAVDAPMEAPLPADSPVPFDE
jgi:MFS family permease